MFNWNVDEERFQKEDPENYRLWRLGQLINYGFDDKDNLDIVELKKAWPKIKENIDPYLRRFTEYILWETLYSLPPSINFWNWPPRMKK